MTQSLKGSVAMIFALFTLSANAQTLDNASHIEKQILQAQVALEHLSTSSTSDWDVFVAISKSMPESSLTRLAQDAAQTKLPLVLQGVGVMPTEKEKKATVLQTYGKHWIARHLDDWAFITQRGATLQIDPVRFTQAKITDVPQLVLMKRCQKGKTCGTSPLVLRVRGDVTLGYAINDLKKSLREKDNGRYSHLSEEDKTSALRLLEALSLRLEGSAS